MNQTVTEVRVQTRDEVVITAYGPGCNVLLNEKWTARPPQADPLIQQVGPPGLDSPEALWVAVYQQVLFADPDTHRRLRTVLDGPLVKYGVQRPSFIAFVEDTTNALIEDALQAGAIDLERAFAAPLAIRVMARLIGLPDEQMNVEQLALWSTAMLNVTTGYRMGQSLGVVQQMAAAFRAIIAAKQRCPTDDLTSALATSADLADETERVLLLMTTWSAGTTTLVTALVNGLPLLLADQEQLNRLRTDLREGRASLTRVIDELLRVVTPTQALGRWATEEVSLEGRTVRAGCPIRVHLARMNHDPELFPDPLVLNCHRGREPGHAAFGAGSHKCPGAPQALLVLRIALAALLALPGLRLVSQEAGWNDHLNPRNQPRLSRVLVSASPEAPCQLASSRQMKGTM